MTVVREIQAKTLLSTAKTPDPWFGIKYTMNLYRGCQHRCIYCDSRSECYRVDDFDGEVLVKANALELLRTELRRKSVKGYVGTGSMNDPYMPVEREKRLTQGALEILAEYAFPVHILTKSDLVLRDAALLANLDRVAASPQSPGAIISFTITTADDDLARRLEPGAPSPSRRYAAMETLAAQGRRTGVMLMPVLPFIEDDPASVARVVRQAVACGASHVVPGWGMTLRDRQREYFYRELDARFPGIRTQYERSFGDRYHAPARNTARLEALFTELAETCELPDGRPQAGGRRLERVVAPYIPATEQPALF
jgi:DNA repair photolyase